MSVPVLPSTRPLLSISRVGEHPPIVHAADRDLYRLLAVRPAVIKPALALLSTIVAFGVPAELGARSTPSSPAVADRLLARMNSSPDGVITRRVACHRLPGSGRIFACRLESVRGTSLRADVRLVDGGAVINWYALAG